MCVCVFLLLFFSFFVFRNFRVSPPADPSCICRGERGGDKDSKIRARLCPPWRESYFRCRRNVMQTASRSENATMLTHRPPLIVRLHVCETMANHASEITVSEGARVSANVFVSN